MKLLYFGSGAFGIPALAQLVRDHQLLAVVTQPDRPAGRKRVLTPTPVAAWVAGQQAAGELDQNIPVYKPENVNEEDILARMRAFPANAWVVVAFGQKLSEQLLADKFAINLHASLLPRWRGAAPINHAILAGDRATGNSVITLASRMDAGLILGQSHREIDPLITAGELHDQLARDGAPIVQQVLAQHAANQLKPIEQDESLVTLAPKLSRANAWIDFTQPAEQCRRQIHGLTPWPGVPVAIAGAQLKLIRAQVIEPNAEQEEGAESSSGALPDAAPGTLVNAQHGIVRCGEDTYLKILETHPAGKRTMPWADFARGQRLENGCAIESSLNR